MELRQLRTFQVVAEELNMTKAAKRLKYTQPTISLQLQSLEKELNVTLITRVGNKNVLTAAGKRLKTHVDRLFELMEEIESDMEAYSQPGGLLTIAASEYYWTHHLHPVIQEYKMLYPNVNISLLPLNSAHGIRSVKNAVADIAIVAGEIREAKVKKYYLEKEQTFLVASSQLTRGKNLQEILYHFPFISYDEDCSFYHIIEKFFYKTKIKPKSTIICGTDEAIKQAVLNDTGYAILGGNIIQDEIKNGKISILQQIDDPINTYAIHLKERSQEPNIETFTQILQQTWPTLS